LKMGDDKEDKKRRKMRVVQIDGLVLLKIIKHCHENVPKPVTGTLLGLDIKETLEVTNCFPLPSDCTETETHGYQKEMMKNLRTVNVDNNNVGWYRSSVLGSYMRQSVIDDHYIFQKDLPKSVLIVYDTYRSTLLGRVVIKAFRLNDSFMPAYPYIKQQIDLAQQQQQSQQQTSTAASAMTGKPVREVKEPNDILEEVNIKVHNSHLVLGFLYELRAQKNMRVQFDRLGLNVNPFVEKNLDMLSATIDEFASEQSKIQYYYRQVARQKQKIKEDNELRKEAGKPPLPDDERNPLWKPMLRPPRFESNLIANKINLHSQQITSSTAYALNQLYLIESLHKS